MSIPQELLERMTDWRRHLHQFPECGFDLPLTADFVAEKLESFGLEVTRNVGQKGVVAKLSCGDGKNTIGLRADMDALWIQEQSTVAHKSKHEGRMHACGHDGHSTMLLGAAAYLAEHRDFDGTVYFIFQPDEEHGHGAQAMIDDGLFERFPMDSVYGLHNLPGLAKGHIMVRPGSLMASETGFEIVINGKGGHAAMPHRGVDPIVVGSQVVLALQTIVSRNLSALEETAVVSVTDFQTDGTTNVIPSTVTITGDCRCFSEEARSKIEQSMERIVAGTCQAAGANFKFTFTHAFHPLVNSAAETELAIRAAQAVVGEAQVNGNCLPLTISEDFSSMLRVKPGCYILLGNGVESVGGCALHNPKYDFNDHILDYGAGYWVRLVQDILK